MERDDPPRDGSAELAVIGAMEGEAERARALVELAPWLPEPLWPQVLALVAALKDDALQAEALAGLAPYLPKAQWPGARSMAGAIRDAAARSAATAALARHRPRIEPPPLPGEPVLGGPSRRPGDDASITGRSEEEAEDPEPAWLEEPWAEPEMYLEEPPAAVPEAPAPRPLPAVEALSPPPRPAPRPAPVSSQAAPSPAPARSQAKAAPVPEPTPRHVRAEYRTPMDLGQVYPLRVGVLLERHMRDLLPEASVRYAEVQVPSEQPEPVLTIRPHSLYLRISPPSRDLKLKQGKDVFARFEVLPEQVPAGPGGRCRLSVDVEHEGETLETMELEVAVQHQFRVGRLQVPHETWKSLCAAGSLVVGLDSAYSVYQFAAKVPAAPMGVLGMLAAYAVGAGLLLLMIPLWRRASRKRRAAL